MAHYAEATDFNTLDGSGIGRSPVYFVEYTTNLMVLGRCNGRSSKVNLLDLEKEILAATTASLLSDNPQRFAPVLVPEQA